MVGVKKRDLEIILQKIPKNPSPMVRFEQYPTPAGIAADILFQAYLEEDIVDKNVLDLGCGTGIFSIGAKLLSANKVIGVDIDGSSLAIAEGYADALSLDITFIQCDITSPDLLEIVPSAFHTVFQNPPFGAQKSAKGADRVFIEKALELGDKVYSLHLTKTEQFIEQLVNACGGEVIEKKLYTFPINYMFKFHTKETALYDVTLFKIQRK